MGTAPRRDGSSNVRLLIIGLEISGRTVAMAATTTTNKRVTEAAVAWLRHGGTAVAWLRAATRLLTKQDHHSQTSIAVAATTSRER